MEADVLFADNRSRNPGASISVLSGRGLGELTAITWQAIATSMPGIFDSDMV